MELEETDASRAAAEAGLGGGGGGAFLAIVSCGCDSVCGNVWGGSEGSNLSASRLLAKDGPFLANVTGVSLWALFTGAWTASSS
jgi:hypothetical protein